MKIGELLSDIKNQDLVLPEFQREYVWTKKKAKQLFVSLLKNYPIGGLLFWKTDTPPDLKNISDKPDNFGTTQVILDGQQRLTTLYMLIMDAIPPYYNEVDIQTDPRGLYFNLESGDLQYYQAMRMKDNPLWISVVDAFKDSAINIFEIAHDTSDDDSNVLKHAELYNHQLNSLTNILSCDIPVLHVPSNADLDDSIDIFDRVNSLGTKLTDAELALTHITGRWSTARREMKSRIDTTRNSGFEFDLKFFTRALTCVVTNHAMFDTIHKREKIELTDGWEIVKNITDYLVGLLPNQAFVHSVDDLNTNNVLIPLYAYLANNGYHFPDKKTMRHAIHWLYAAHTWARYTSQTDQRLEHDVTLIVREKTPWNALREQIIDQRGRIEVKASDFEGRWAQHPLYRMVGILVKAHDGIDWFNGLPLCGTQGESYKIHSHHIFPQSQLYKHSYDPDNHLHRKIVNEIANRAFLTADTNYDISDRLPEDYLPEVKEKYPGALVHQFIPIDESLWKLDAYADFLEARREIIASKLNEYMDSLIKEPEPVRDYSINELIKLGESVNLEFKSTLRWDIIQKIQKGSTTFRAETIAAFLNSDGGTLIIGVEDNGQVFGLENDLKTLGNSKDKFLQTLSSLIHSCIGSSYSQFIKSRIKSHEGKSICVVDVDKSTEPAFLKNVVKDTKEFYVRVGNTSRSLDPQETINYIEMRSV